MPQRMNRLHQRDDSLGGGGRGTPETKEGAAMRKQAEKDAERRKKKQGKKAEDGQ